MDYMSAQDAAEKWGITKRRVQLLCASQRIDNVTRVGNMWIIPADAQKPCDNRFKNKKETIEIQHKNPIRVARNKIKAITTHGMNKLFDDGYSHKEAKIILISAFSCELLWHYITQNIVDKNVSLEQKNAVKQSISSATNYILVTCEAIDEISLNVQQFVEEFSFCCDDALSWCYQYANKMDPNSRYSNTQFFTEKYMITAIVDSIDITSREKILDPACGGGNFLLYCIDSLCENGMLPNDDKQKCIDILKVIVDKLYGYEIDSTLALVASINLRLKCLSTLAELGYIVSSSDFDSFSPNIYFPIAKTVAGALDAKKHKQELSRVGADEKVNIDEVFNEVDAIITNPPFQTIKGMPSELKEYLKTNYSFSKCDMCNAFIELSKSVLVNDGIAGMVTQNSWMYLDSFIELRKSLLSSCSVDRIWELGSNAFYDLNGEKSNVALVLYRQTRPDDQHNVTLSSLKSLSTEHIEELLSIHSNDTAYTQHISQKNILNNFEARFDMISSNRLRELIFSFDRYGKFAIPMQGTSTGNAKELIDYFWKHFEDKEWILVSKGGGCSRWQGLNHYCVKWGNDGEYIKAQKGSAIRNASYFNQTQMVFSDTGTSGLNVRELQDGQIFVASGPGIRVKQGKPYAHLAFLNSRMASYYIRLLSPKLTIAAGYISKIPTCAELLYSKAMDKSARVCLNAKKRRLSKRPFNFEFTAQMFSTKLSVEEQAFQWFMEDIQDEWEQLQQEDLIDKYVYSVMEISDADIAVIENYIGKKSVKMDENERPIKSDIFSHILNKAIDHNCNITRTKSEKKHLGCDGILEFLSQKTDRSCEAIYNYITTQKFYPKEVRLHYENLLLHSVVMSTLDYRSARKSISVSDLIKSIDIPKNFDIGNFRKWIISDFNLVHSESFLKKPIFVYNPTSDEFKLVEEKENE